MPKICLYCKLLIVHYYPSTSLTAENLEVTRVLTIWANCVYLRISVILICKTILWGFPVYFLFVKANCKVLLFFYVLYDVRAKLQGKRGCEFVLLKWVVRFLKHRFCSEPIRICIHFDIKVCGKIIFLHFFFLQITFDTTYTYSKSILVYDILFFWHSIKGLPKFYYSTDLCWVVTS